MNRWLNDLKRYLVSNKGTQPTRRTSRRLGLEALEARLAPAAGALDLTFGIGGKVTTSFGPAADTAQSVALQADGKLVVVGYTTRGSDLDFALARYDISGALDPTFGAGGRVTTPYGSELDIAFSVAVQSDGKLLVAGASYNGNSFDLSLARYDTSGALDPTFGRGGKAPPAFSQSKYYIGRVLVALQADGKVIVAGTAEGGVALARYDTSGALDLTFGTGGRVSPPGSPSGSATGLALQADGKILVAGSAYNGTNSDFALSRYDASGALDPTFGTGGTVITSFGSADESASGLAVQADGKVVVAGTTRDGSAPQFALARYDTSGALDPTFGIGGKVTTRFGSVEDIAHSVAVQADGKLLVAGSAHNGANSDFALARYDPSGALDPTFGTGGKVTSSFGSGIDDAESALVQADGKVVVVGYTSGIDGTFDLALARYLVSNGNNEPAGADKTISTGANAPYVFMTADFGFGDINDTPANHLLAIEITTLPGAGTLTDNGVAVTAGQFVSVSDISAGKLVLTPVANASFTFRVQDDGGTANGGMDTDRSTNTITVRAGSHAVTTSALSSSANPSTVGQAVTLSVRVGDMGNVATTGTVTFFDSMTTALGTGTFNSMTGRWELTVSNLALGGHSITATFGGSFYYAASTSQSPLSQAVNLPGANANTTSTVSSSANPSDLGQAVTLSVRIGDTVNVATYGTVTFYDNMTTVLGTGTFDPATGRWKLTLSSLASGLHSITAAFGGNAYYATSTSQTPPLAQTVNAAGTRANTMSPVSSSANPSNVEQVVTLSVRIGDATNVATSGIVNFSEGVTLLGYGTFDPSTGRWVLRISTLASGSHVITATYSGNGYYSAGSSQGPPLTQFVR